MFADTTRLWCHSLAAVLAATLAATGPVLAQPPAPAPATPAADAPTGPEPGADLLVTPAARAPQNDPSPKPPFRSYWDYGLFAETDDKSFLIHVGGTLQYDGGWFAPQPSLMYQPGGTRPIEDGTTPRRIRLRSDGRVYDDADFFLEVEFINGFTPATQATDANTVTIPSITDAYLIFRETPLVGNLKVGNHKEPLLLEHLNSDRYLEFMERSFLQDASNVSGFNNGFSPGVQVFNSYGDEKRAFTAVGGYKNISDPFGFGIGNGQYAVTGRVAALPVWADDGNTYWHVGGAMSHRDPVNGNVQVRIRGQVRAVPGPLLPVYADTGSVTSDSNDVFGLETAFVTGPLTTQAEYLANVVRGASVGKGPPLGDVVYNGYYVQALYFLTGEHRSWNRNFYTFNRVAPKNNFSRKNKTWGAFEVGARYSYLDLTNNGVTGGRLNDVVLGLTWYLNPITRIYFNYEYLYRDETSNPLAKGVQHAFGTRFAFEF